MKECRTYHKRLDKRKRTYVLLVFQVACLTIIVMNATLLSEIIYKWLVGNAGLYQGLVAGVAVLSIFETMNNWASIKKYIEHYNSVTLFVLDIITLGIFYGQSYILAKVEKSNHILFPTQKSLYFILASYVLLYMLYLIWNILICRDENIPLCFKEKIRYSIRWRSDQLILGIAFLCLPWFLEHVVEAFPWQIVRAQIISVSVYVVGGGVILISTQKLSEVLKIIMEAEELKNI